MQRTTSRVISRVIVFAAAVWLLIYSSSCVFQKFATRRAPVDVVVAHFEEWKDGAPPTTRTRSVTGVQKFTETEIAHRAGMFSQLFIFLSTFISDLQHTNSSSSARWKISSYSPQEGSGWESGRFEDVFLPVRVDQTTADILLPEGGNFYEQTRAYAEYLYRPNSQVEFAITQFLNKTRLDPDKTVCLHVRRGDKKEGIRQVHNQEIFKILELVAVDAFNVYLLTDDKEFERTFPEMSKARNLSQVVFSEEACVREAKLTRLQCFIVSVMVASRNICDTFVGSSTSNLSRFLMLLGPKRFVDIDGVMDYVTTKLFGRWYKPPGHCYVVDGTLSSGEHCGYISHRCPYCRKHACLALPVCDIPL